MCGLVELEGVVPAVLVEIGGEDIENGFLRQDGRINKSQSKREIQNSVPTPL